jgi:Mlc titration factor MtfA (ptsG expression regulator)
MNSIYSEDYVVVDEETKRLSTSIELFIKNKYLDGYDVLEIESELIAVICSTVCELKLKKGLEVRKQLRNK